MEVYIRAELGEDPLFCTKRRTLYNIYSVKTNRMVINPSPRTRKEALDIIKHQGLKLKCQD